MQKALSTVKGGEAARRFLVVDDDTELRANLTEVLQDAGYLTGEASNGYEAMERLAAQHFDIVFLDLMMPGMNGIDVLPELKRISPETRIIMLTAFASVGDAVEAIKKGANDFIAKPVKIFEILDAVRYVLADGPNRSIYDPVSARVLKLLHESDPMGMEAIARSLGMQLSASLSDYIAMLHGAGMLGRDAGNAYFITDAGHKAIECIRVVGGKF